ncbi:hypothetical protein Z046_31595 [Pseudomonas aeruginosa VRFPA09]|nr:hypothetical protein Z046_31595 [Pseudomonas aeruginosa VRFPA09]
MAIARICPLFGFTRTAEPECAPNLSTAFSSAL